jgi:hypothetical protein
MLVEALHSIAGQTAVGKIDRIIVSENGGDRASQAVCAQFPQLPITYLFREPAVGPVEHAQLLMKECLHGEFTAILHDDDAWLPNHLANALAALEAYPDASVFGANLVMLENGVLLTGLSWDLLARFAANFAAPAPCWRLSHTNILLASLLNYIVHYSSMVARTDALRQSAYVYDLGNPYDNDRMIIFALSRCGPVLFHPEVSVVVRVHGNRETVRFGHDERTRHMCQTTEWMVAQGVKSWSAIAAAFAQRVTGCPDAELKIKFLRDATTREWCLPEIARHLDRGTEKDFFAMYDRARETFAGEKPRDER